MSNPMRCGMLAGAVPPRTPQERNRLLSQTTALLSYWNEMLPDAIATMSDGRPSAVRRRGDVGLPFADQPAVKTWQPSRPYATAGASTGPGLLSSRYANGPSAWCSQDGRYLLRKCWACDTRPDSGLFSNDASVCSKG